MSIMSEYLGLTK